MWYWNTSLRVQDHDGIPRGDLQGVVSAFAVRQHAQRLEGDAIPMAHGENCPTPKRLPDRAWLKKGVPRGVVSI
jgi:hypothetical protein